MSDLKPCPFCGKQKLSIKTVTKKFADGPCVYYFVECDSCGGRSGEYQKKEHAITMWEARTIPSHIVPILLKELQAMTLYTEDVYER